MKALNITIILAVALLYTGCQAVKTVTKSELEAAQAIDRVLLASSQFAQGMHQALEYLLHNRKDRDKILICFSERMDPEINKFFSLLIVQALTSEEITKGAELAQSPAFEKINKYIMENHDALASEAEAAGQRMDDYFLLAAASKLDIPASQRQSVVEFVDWHRKVTPKMNIKIKAIFPPFENHIKQVVTECVQTNQ
jgi:hypothetical protein